MASSDGGSLLAIETRAALAGEALGGVLLRGRAGIERAGFPASGSVSP
jgi:hypothetical protein